MRRFCRICGRFRHRMWQDIPILVMVSILAYFCFLEQLLIKELGPRALALSLPFSGMLGLLSSCIACTMVSRAYIWTFASFQFAIVVLFAHIFYTLLQIASVFSILLASFSGFGVSVGANVLFIEFLKWREMRNNSSEQQSSENSVEAEQVEGTRLQETGSYMSNRNAS